MRPALVLVFMVWCTVSLAGTQAPPKDVVTGLTNPESVVVNPQGEVFVSVMGEADRDGDGAVLKIDHGKAVPFASGFDDPKGLVAYERWLFVADKHQVCGSTARAKRRSSRPRRHSRRPRCYSTIWRSMSRAALFT